MDKFAPLSNEGGKPHSRVGQYFQFNVIHASKNKNLSFYRPVFAVHSFQMICCNGIIKPIEDIPGIVSKTLCNLP